MFGGLLQHCRAAFLPLPEDVERLLVAGDGDGRFLAEAHRRHRTLKSIAIDSSERMLELACRRCQFAENRITFLHADLTEPNSIPITHCDVVATHFFLDCFSLVELPLVIDTLATATPQARHWLVSEFQLPKGKLSGWVGSLLVGFLQRFFHMIAGTSATALPEYGPLLEAHGYHLRDRKMLLRGLLVSEHWERPAQTVS